MFYSSVLPFKLKMLSSVIIYVVFTLHIVDDGDEEKDDDDDVDIVGHTHTHTDDVRLAAKLFRVNDLIWG